MSSMRDYAPVLGAALLVGVLIASVPAGVQSSAVVGVCYGIVGNNLPSPHDVVQLYGNYNIFNMRVYSAEPSVLNALRNMSLNLILGTTNNDVAFLAASASNAASWVQTYIVPYYPDIKIKYIAVGNELRGDAAHSIYSAMQNLNSALNATVFSTIKLLATTGAPLLANVYPYFAYSRNPSNITLSYATFQSGAPSVKDSGNGLVYTNLFDAMVDGIYTALEKAGALGVRVVVSESGWPSAGGVAATMENAKAYNQGLIDHVAYGVGTPKKPEEIEAYLFSMFNENKKPGEETERNFGLFYPTNKMPVYLVNFAGTIIANHTRSHGSGRHN
ncbi:unnamed protein product [Alopecurus aequalis]